MNPLYIIIAVALVVPNVRLPSWLVKHPPTAELVAAQQAATDAKAREATAVAELAAAKAKQQAAIDAQLAYAQQMTTGAGLALGKVKPAQMTPEIQLAADLTTRALAGLDAARGKLSPEAQAEMTRLVDHALSGITAERDAALAALRDKDTDLQVTIREKQALAAKVPVLEASVQTATAARLLVEAKHDTLEKEVTAYAQKADAEKTDNGTLRAFINRMSWSIGGVAAVLAALYYVAHFALPSLAQENPTTAWLQKLNANVKSIVSAHL